MTRSASLRTNGASSIRFVRAGSGLTGVIWTAGALWQDIKFDARHFSDIERMAIVGETKWQQGMAVFCKPFTAARIRYFDRPAIEEARGWLASG